MALCYDRSSYLAAAHALWKQPETTKLVTPPSDPTHVVMTTMTGLTPGTHYLCAIAARNSEGITPALTALFPHAVNTFASYSNTVSTDDASCNF